MNFSLNLKKNIGYIYVTVDDKNTKNTENHENFYTYRNKLQINNQNIPIYINMKF